MVRGRNPLGDEAESRVRGAEPHEETEAPNEETEPSVCKLFIGNMNQ